MPITTPMWIDAKPIQGSELLEVRNPFNGDVVGKTTYANSGQTEAALESTYSARDAGRSLPIHVRADALAAMSRAISTRAEEFAERITQENGKPIMWARAETQRAAEVFRWASEYARQWSGDVMRLDTEPASERRVAFVERAAIGSVLGISPFNFPLNLAAHKVAPAIAVGAPILLKPAPKTPLSGLLLGELAAETDLPAGLVNVINVRDDVAQDLVTDPRISIISFTGSTRVGHAIREAAPHKRVTLELGGNAAVYVAADYASEEQLAYAADRIALFANYQAGQSCVGVQRIYIHESVYERTRSLILSAVERLGTGDPFDPDTHVGPLVNESEARRVSEWVSDALASGATLMTGGRRRGATLEPTVLEEASEESSVMCEEIFGPVMVLNRVRSDSEALDRINASRFGLQAGVFTRQLDLAFRAYRELRVGGVIIGDVPSYRADHMPYGGVKESGSGREGLRFAMEDFTEPRVMVLTGVDL